MAPLERVLWIGGPSGAGKSTAARLLARRHGFRWYSSDTKTWNHRDRAVAAGDRAAVEWEALSPAERSALPFEEEQRLRLDRDAMTREDLAELPDQPAIVADGTPFTPALVGGAIAGPNRIPMPSGCSPMTRRERRDLARGWGGAGNAADLQRRTDLETAVDDANGIVITTSNHPTAQDTVAAIELACRGWIRQQPAAATIFERRALIREGNSAIVEQYRAGLARPWSRTQPREVIRTYDCECARPGCIGLVDLALNEVPDPFSARSSAILAPGHG